MPRLFTAIEIPADIRQSLAMLRGGVPGARWIDPENYHLTLRFIGDIDDAMAREMASMLDGVVADGVRLAPRRTDVVRRQQTACHYRDAAPTRQLLELQAEHERLMQRVGLEPEGRKYTPHVTLARLRNTSSRDVADYLGDAALSGRCRFASRVLCCIRRAHRSAADLTSSRRAIRSRPDCARAKVSASMLHCRQGGRVSPC